MEIENIYVSLIVLSFSFIVFMLYMNVRYNCCN